MSRTAADCLLAIRYLSYPAARVAAS
jgi:hypothetical protein